MKFQKLPIQQIRFRAVSCRARIPLVNEPAQAPPPNAPIGPKIKTNGHFCDCASSYLRKRNRLCPLGISKRTVSSVFCIEREGIWFFYMFIYAFIERSSAYVRCSGSKLVIFVLCFFVVWKLCWYCFITIIRILYK